MKIYDAELETSFRITKQLFYQALYSDDIRILNTLFITQCWLEESVIGNGVRKRTRVRRTVIDLPSPFMRPDAREPIYEFTTKYYLTNSKRMELNAVISPQEYAVLLELYRKNNKGDLVNKIRKLWAPVKDPQLGVHLSADFYQDTDLVTVEVEFDNEGCAKDWVPPQWLIEAEKETNARGESGK